MNNGTKFAAFVLIKLYPGIVSSAGFVLDGAIMIDISTQVRHQEEMELHFHHNSIQRGSKTWNLKN